MKFGGTNYRGDHKGKYLDTAEFQRILEIGLGRAILHLKSHDSKPYREGILYACTHNTVYDTQIEGGHYEYLRDVLQATGEPEYYHDPLLAALLASPADNEDKDAWQLYDLAQFFVEQGSQEARQAIFDKFASNVKAGSLIGAGEILELDGLEGFLFIADKIQVPEDDTYYYYGLLPNDLEEEYGKDAVWQALDKASDQSPAIKAYAQAIVQYRKEENTRKPTERSKPFKGHYDEIKELLKHPNPLSKAYTSNLWGKSANGDDLEQAARDFLGLPEDNLDTLIVYLNIFKSRSFPLDPAKLIKLALSKTSKLTWEGGWPTKPDRVVLAALAALENINHPDIRRLALSLIEGSAWIGWAVDLLANNYQETDWQHIVEPTTTRELDAYTYHGLGMSIRNLFEAHPSKDAVNTLINLYNNGPYSFCRFFLVEFLHSLDALPAWMIEECKYDSNVDIREWVNNGFKRLTG
jgi:hypothetical protein